ncbi:MAG: nucleotidyl transferase AbiEii/AbiGii toxin family protein [Gammaproteobacteria bacterium]|nr:nucleotidyl transferase AbiEii/AbiGii toxin family protein [Gammaproteobacteria bacterium]
MKFNHPHHQKIQKILLSLNPALFEDTKAYFGGGTLLSLRFNEYRWSKDIDFLCTVGEGYKLLRELVDDSAYDGLFLKTDGLEFPRDISTHQSGIRFPVKVDDTIIKFEIVLEGRISLGSPEYLDWCLLPCLNLVDTFTEKLLANADRWNDTSVEARDLIDLCVLRGQHNIPQESIHKANAAYEVEKSLKRAIKSFQNNPEFRDRCFTSLQIADRMQILEGLDLLAKDLGMASTKRTIEEAHPEHEVYLRHDHNDEK